ncbi:hypothetical protein [Streptomyces roseicoloratus]|uniref:hypothetical protein n=1 Tax=Streptomyces roseicoloratus TaxID=2508722 RepID=UPI001009B24E|nr:hypothetical protein [Streptomyces roseicoloratus]
MRAGSEFGEVAIVTGADRVSAGVSAGVSADVSAGVSAGVAADVSAGLALDWALSPTPGDLDKP